MNRYEEFEILIRRTLKRLGCNKEASFDQLKRANSLYNPTPGGVYEQELRLLVQYFYSIIFRRLKPLPRRTVIRPSFDCKGNDAGIRNFQLKSERGDDLTSNMSRNLFDLDQGKYNDAMLVEWGIYHFHIPETDGSRAKVTGTNDLLFAITKPDGPGEALVFLEVMPHPDGCGYEPWTDVNIFQCLEKYYPELVAHLKVGEARTPLTIDQRKNLRGRKVNTNIITSSGIEYQPPSGRGFSSTGYPSTALFWSDKAMHSIDQFERNACPGVLRFDSKFSPELTTL